MSARTQYALKALILVGLAIFLADKLFNGALYYYIAPRFAWLSLVAVALLIILAQSYGVFDRPQESAAHEHDHHEHQDHQRGKASPWPLLIVALPVILGVLVPARPLGTNAAATRGVSTDIALAADTASTLTVVPAERNVLDWVLAMTENPAPDALDGEEADVIGFVYRDPYFAEDQFMVARFVLVCCVADASPIGVVGQWPDAAELKLDSWVRVKGTFAAGEMSGEPMPVLVAASVEPVDAPAQPYLYP
jgi:uncharacterized repeat protein (TIGR03943 family)